MADFDLQAQPKLENGEVVWSLCYKKDSPCPPAGSFGPIDLQRGWFAKTYNFQIDIKNDQTGMGIVFAPDPGPPPSANDGPVWIQAGSKPTAQLIDGHVSKVSAGGTTSLTFKDKNGGDAVNLFYRLNFVSTQGPTQGQKVSPIDPEIKNGGSTFGIVLSAPILLISLAVIAGLIVVAFRAFK